MKLSWSAFAIYCFPSSTNKSGGS